IDTVVEHLYLPPGRHLTAMRLTRAIELDELNLVATQCLNTPVTRNQRPRAIVLAILLANLKQHQLVAAVQMQREPVPALLFRRQRLTAPFAIQPGQAIDAITLALIVDFSVDAIKGLAVVIRCLPL